MPNFLLDPKTFSPVKPPPRASSETTLEIAVLSIPRRQLHARRALTDVSEAVRAALAERGRWCKGRIIESESPRLFGLPGELRDNGLTCV